MIDILGGGGGDGKGSCIDRGFLEDMAWLMQCLRLYLEVLGDPLKKGGPTN